MTDMPSVWLTAEECALYLRYMPANPTEKQRKNGLDCLYHAIRRLGLPASHMGGSRTLRFHRQYVDQWVQQGTAKAAR